MNATEPSGCRPGAGAIGAALGDFFRALLRASAAHSTMLEMRRPQGAALPFPGISGRGGGLLAAESVPVHRVPDAVLRLADSPQFRQPVVLTGFGRGFSF